MIIKSQYSGSSLPKNILQKMLEERYQGEEFLIDQLLHAVDIPEIQISLKDVRKRNVSHVIRRKANRLSEKTKRAEVLIEVLIETQRQLEEDKETIRRNKPKKRNLLTW